MVPFWGRCTTHCRTYFSGDWNVHWGRAFDPWPYILSLCSGSVSIFEHKAQVHAFLNGVNSISSSMTEVLVKLPLIRHVLRFLVTACLCQKWMVCAPAFLRQMSHTFAVSPCKDKLTRKSLILETIKRLSGGRTNQIHHACCCCVNPIMKVCYLVIQFLT